ncbi:MAG: hypothetical protein JOZ72_18920 [Alphaproteobacteria bacterium]|nr:hypothetical protein [Alphaproteobacteria bacterium]
MNFNLRRRPSSVRLVAASLAGSVVGIVVLIATLAADWDRVATMVPPDQGLGVTLARIALTVLLGGTLPTVLIGAVLTALKRANAVTLVLTPAILFLLILARIGDAGLAYAVLPAMIAGAAAMLWLLATAKPAPEPVHLVFE